MEDLTEIQSSDLSTFMFRYDNLPIHELDNLKQDHVVVVMVPFPIQGHLNQLLQLAGLISSSYELPVYYVGSSTLIRQARDVSSLPNVESYVFTCISAFNWYYFSCLLNGMSVQLQEELLKKLPSLEGEMPNEVRKFMALQGPYMDIRSDDIHNTSKLIEGEFLDLLAQVENKQQWGIGPILPTKLDHTSNSNNICLEWLNKQPLRSVLYVSFGISTTFSDREVMELVMGLEQSKQKFIWVLREADRGDIFIGGARRLELPEEFKERVKGVGLVVREWAPQPEISAHSSTS
ncbi:putative LRR receptor-like serine/threonine-protein kinase EFR-like [Capsicum annuum]|nr:putative LRR receptor-like serine/threonine-protein kinase EFR-like [Capsicum annuum]